MHELANRIALRTAPLGQLVRELLRGKDRMAASILVTAVLLGAAVGPMLAPREPLEQNLARRLARPSREYPLGSDELGRCILSRILHGARISVGVAAAVVVIAAVAGTALGAVAGYVGGAVDRGIMGLVEVMLAFPALILAIVIAGLLGPSLVSAVLALSAVHWTAYARLMRGTVLAVREEPYVEAARASGAGTARLLLRHILPNCLAPGIVMASFGLGHMLLAASALSFLGLGVQPPASEWGTMLSRGREFMRSAPHLMTYPGLAIMVSVFAFNLFGDALQDSLGLKRRVDVDG